jgi:thiosulfate reductase cytochrome b subunit
MVNRELLQGQKLLGWVLILAGLVLLMLIGLAESLERSFPHSMLGTLGSWAAKAQGNQTIVGVVAWFLLAGGYIFVLSARVEERLRDIGGELEERICHLSRELAALGQRLGDRSGAEHPEGSPGTRPASGPGP